MLPGSPVPCREISSGGQQMAGSPKLAICPFWITSPTRICHPPALSRKAFSNELQKGTVCDLYLWRLSTSRDDGTCYTRRDCFWLMMGGLCVSVLYALLLVIMKEATFHTKVLCFVTSSSVGAQMVFYTELQDLDKSLYNQDCACC